MKAIEALEAMKQGEKVCLYFPDCEMYSLTGTDRIEIYLVDLGDGANKPCDICSPNQFLSSFANKEFELFDPDKQIPAH